MTTETEQKTVTVTLSVKHLELILKAAHQATMQARGRIATRAAWRALVDQYAIYRNAQQGDAMGKLLSREQAIQMYNRLEEPVWDVEDSDTRLEGDLRDAQRLEIEDWHTSDRARKQLVERAERLGWDVEGATLFDKYSYLIDQPENLT